MKGAFWAFVVSFLCATVFVAPFLKHEKQEGKISQLQDKLNIKSDTKQEIRAFLESISPLILEKIDTKEGIIGIWFGNRNENKFLDLAEYPDFEKFLSFEKGLNSWHMTKAGVGKEGHKGLIWGMNDSGLMYDYYLYPKDALIKYRRNH